METFLQLLGEYGTRVLAWFAVILTTLASKYVWSLISNMTVRGIVDRAWAELVDAIREVAQTFTDELKAANSDGKLTPAEAAEARRRAMVIFRSNLGPKGLKRLGRVLGVDVENWARGKLESVVDARKLAMRSPGGAGNPPAPETR